MHITRPINSKKLNECQVGELILAPVSDQWIYAIVLAGLASDDVLVGILKGLDEQTPEPFYISLRGIKSCISFGTDWTIEPVLSDQTYPGNRRYQGRGGSLHTATQSIFICFTSFRGFEDTIYFDLTNNERLEVAAVNAAPITKWRLWVSEQEFIRPNAEPLLQFDLEA